MTRLTTDDITGIGPGLPQYDRRLQAQTGKTLAGIACHAAGMAEADFSALRQGMRVGVVPLTCGQGAIGGFCGAVAAVAGHLGFESFVTRATDAAGMAEACERGAGIVLSADDDCFVALDFHTGKVSDNSVLTARGFVAGLDLMAGGLAGRHVLVIGCGPVGAAAAEALLKRGARVSVHDVNAERLRNLARAAGIAIEASPAMGDWALFFDASSGTDIIGVEHVHEKTLVAAPGMPCGVGADAAEKLGPRLLHDPLQIGVAAMLVDTLAARLHNGNIKKGNFPPAGRRGGHSRDSSCREMP